MNFFKTGLQSVLGSSEGSQELNGAETVSGNFKILNTIIINFPY